jgi:hypothetical protein
MSGRPEEIRRTSVGALITAAERARRPTQNDSGAVSDDLKLAMG